MISLYTGTPGSGKSLHLAYRIYNCLRYGKPVIANFFIDLSKIRKIHKKSEFLYLDNKDLSPDKLIRYSYNRFSSEKKKRKVKEDSILLVIDESQILFNSRSWNEKNNNRDEWISFFSQHRKYGYEIVLVAQFDMMIDKQIRSLVEYQFIHRRVSNFGIFGKVISFISFGKLFASVKIWYPIKEKVGQEFFKAHKKYYQIYDSYADFFNTNKDIDTRFLCAVGSDPVAGCHAPGADPADSA